MSKIAEKKALETYPPENGTIHQRLGYVKGYDQAMKDLLKDANQYMFLSDEIGYVYACGCRKTMQDFMEKAEDAISMISNHYVGEDYSFDQIWEQFKNYMQDESEN